MLQTVSPPQVVTMEEKSSSDVTILDYVPGSGLVQVKDEPLDDYECDVEESEDDDEEEESEPASTNRVYIEPETTIKYIKGEMTFEEYSELLERGKQTEVVVEVEEVSALEEVVSSENPDEENTPHGAQEEMKRRRRSRKKQKTRLPRSLLGLMGEANMRFARGNHEDAKKMCMEVIRQEPSAWEPFQTLAMIYEEAGDQEKCLQYSLIASHISNRGDPDEWVKVAVMCVEMGKIEQAIMCYTKALKFASTNVELWWARSDLYERVGEKKKAMDGYQHILSLLPKDNGDKYFQLTRDMAKEFHSTGDSTKALAAMQSAFEEHPSFANIEDTNLLIELSITQRVFNKPIAALVQHGNVVLEYPDGKVIKCSKDQPVTDIPPIECQPTRCVVPEELHIDLTSKLIVCLIHCHFLQCAEEVGHIVLAGDPNVVGDLFLDIAEAYMEEGQYETAKEYLLRLVHTDNYTQFAAVWLKYGECLNSTGDVQSAVDAYKQVVELAPGHLGARVTLSALHQQLGRPQEALQVLHNPEQEVGRGSEGPCVDPWLLLQRCWLLYSQANWQEFISCAKQILNAHIKNLLTPDVLKTILSYRSMKHRMEAVRYIHGCELDAQINAATTLMKESPININDLWKLYTQLAKLLVELKRFDELEKLSISALVCPQFTQDEEKAAEADFICLTACIMNRNGHYAYPFIRDICRKNLNNQRAWNLFAQIISISQDLRHNRFCLRLILKHPENEPLSILNGHNALVAGTYRHALGEYIACFKKRPDDPLLSLCVGITFVHMASQKFSTKRHSLVIQACSFLNEYLELRGECQESYYNLGRAMHQLNLLHAAEFHYKKALSFPPAVGGPNGNFDLTHEIACNLMLMYNNSDSKELAAYIMQKYLVI